MTALCTGKTRAFWYTGDDAARLLAAGVIADIQVLRQRLLSAARGLALLRSNHYGRGLGFTSFKSASWCLW